jgi:hypothetical protein
MKYISEGNGLLNLDRQISDQSGHLFPDWFSESEGGVREISFLSHSMKPVSVLKHQFQGAAHYLITQLNLVSFHLDFTLFLYLSLQGPIKGSTGISFNLIICDSHRL